jgi:flagellar motor switch protein FliN/FliY
MLDDKENKDIDEELKAFDEEIGELDDFDSSFEESFSDEDLDSELFSEIEEKKPTEEVAEAVSPPATEESEETEVANTEVANTKEAAEETAEGIVSPVAASEENIKPQDIPMTIAVELGRINMSIQTLFDLQAGNMLDLNVTPEQGVNLTVQGKKIARGELMRVGDVLGVRILEIDN